MLQIEVIQSLNPGIKNRFKYITSPYDAGEKNIATFSKFPDSNISVSGETKKLKNLNAGINKYLLILFLSLIHVLPVFSQAFQLIIIPDTQWASQKWPELTRKMTEWIVENRKKENIKYVLQVGDLVEVGSSEQEWKNIDSSFKVLDNKVPYIVAVGNHDYDRINPPKSTVLFNRYFPVDRFKKMKGFGGSYSEGTNSNSYHTFKAGGKKWLILSLNFSPDEKEITWGNQVIKSNPYHQIILLTHSYLTHTKRDVIGDTLWNNLLRSYPNVSIVFCGHLSTVHFKSEGDNGNSVCEMLFDWQNDREPDPNSYLAIINIDPKAATISARSYSPALNKYLEGSRNQFQFTDVRYLDKKHAKKK
jgi:predicted phosphodiesterase